MSSISTVAAETNRGRAYFSSLRDLEQKVFVDFIRNRSRRVR